MSVTTSVNNYWISPNAIAIELNTFGDPEYIQVSVLSNAVILAYYPGIITFNAAHDYRSWNLQASNTFFESTTRKHVYARLPRNEASREALIVFPDVRLDIYGNEIIAGEDNENTDGDYYYIYLGTISASISETGATIERYWETQLNFGMLSTDQMTEEQQKIDIIRTGDLRPFTDENVLSALRSLEEFVSRKNDQDVQGILNFLNGFKINGNLFSKAILSDTQVDKLQETDFLSALRVIQEIAERAISKIKDDQTEFLIKFLGGLHVGEFIDSLIAGKGIGFFPNGRAQLSRLEVRESLSVLELIFNRLSAMESDYSFSESGTVESVTLMEDGTYTLKLRKRWENDFTALQENDIIYGVVNNLASGGGEYYTSWARVLSVDTAANSINVVLYPDGEVPGGQNFPPVELMMLTRRGNPVDEDRQSWWYLSSREGCLCMLDGVTKPVLEESNYSVIVGKLKQLSIFDNLPINYRQSYVYCRGIAAQDVMRIDYQGNPIRQENQRGLWSAEEAVSNPYQSTQEVYDSVYHYGCKWMCLLTGTTQEPRYGCTDWAMIEGNPAFTIDIESSNGWYFDAEKFATTLSITGMLYNRDVTAHILDEDVSWTRDTGNVTEDNAWAAAHAESGKVLPLTLTDLGPDFMKLTGCKFIARAILRDGQQNMETVNYVTF